MIFFFPLLFFFIFLLKNGIMRKFNNNKNKIKLKLNKK